MKQVLQNLKTGNTEVTDVPCSVGDRVASSGRHAEAVSVPANLCALVPDRVADEDAAFTVLGAIALQGIRLVQPTLGSAQPMVMLALLE